MYTAASPVILKIQPAAASTGAASTGAASTGASDSQTIPAAMRNTDRKHKSKPPTPKEITIKLATFDL